MPVLFLGISLVSFGLMNLVPGDVTTTEAALNPRVSPEDLARMKTMYGLDKPFFERYWLWLEKMAVFDFGDSLSPHHRPVFWERKNEEGKIQNGLIQEALFVTLLVNALAFTLTFAAGILFGILCAWGRGRFWEPFLSSGLVAAYATPSFWLALLFIYALGVLLPVFPVSGMTSLGFEHFSWWHKLLDLMWHLLLPVVMLSFSGFASLALFLRGSLAEALAAEMVVAARARGLSEWRVWRHALKNALLPVINILGLSLPGLVGGSVIVESIFGLPGMGRLFFQAVTMRDYPVVMGIVVVGAILTLSGTFLADLALAWADPRVRRGMRG